MNKLTKSKGTPESQLPVPPGASDSPAADLEKVSDNLRLRTDHTATLIQLLRREETEKIEKLSEAVVRVSQATDPALISACADAKRRYAGMWVGAGLSAVNVAGGVAVLTSAGPALIGLGLIALGAACAGATFAIITGKTVSADDFSKMLTSSKRAIAQDLKEGE